MLDFGGHIWIDHPRNVLDGGHSHCAKFYCSRCSSFDNIKVLIVGAFGLRMYSRPNAFLGEGRVDH